MKLPKNLLTIDCFALLALPLWLICLVILGFFYVKQLRFQEDLTNRLNNLRDPIYKQRALQNFNEQLKNQYKNPENNYLDINLGSLQLLQQEQSDLSSIIENPLFTGNQAVEQRQDLLFSHNKLYFTKESPIHSEPGLRESQIKSARPVEVDKQDLHNILTLIEAPQPKKPLLFFTSFSLTKKILWDQHQTFELNMKLLSREFSS